MARSISDNDITPAGKKALDFDDDTLRGEKKHVTSFFKRLQKATLILILPLVVHILGSELPEYNPFPEKGQNYSRSDGILY